MSVNELTSQAKIHLIGIGGVSMSGIAELLLQRGYAVSGSDREASEMTDKLKRDGAEIFIGHSGDNITDQDLIVYTAAIKEDNPERVRGREKGIPEMERAGMLGLLMKDYDIPICVSGTHGKTTTTGLLAQTFLECGCDPTVSVGGNLDAIGGNVRIGGKKYFIAEACEYHSSFLSFFPKISIILNIEEDHLDYFRDLDHIIETFAGLVRLTPKDGCVIANADDKNVSKALEGTDRHVVTFGINGPADYTAANIFHDGKDFYSYDLMCGGEYLCHIALEIPGRHNIYNSLATAAAAIECGIDIRQVAAAFGHYCGTHRRFEHKGNFNGAELVDDYAHHPTEINATLTAISEMDYKNIYVVFQPHTFSRTYSLYDDFVRVLSRDGIRLILADIYPAREVDTGLVSSKQLAASIPGAIYFPSFADIESFLRQNAGEGDLVITVGAGDVYKIGENLLKK